MKHALNYQKYRLELISYKHFETNHNIYLKISIPQFIKYKKSEKSIIGF